MGKWIVGFITTLLSGVVIWWLTHSGGILNPIKPPKIIKSPTVDIKLLDSKIDGPDISTKFGKFSGSVVIFNEGNTTAEDCSIWMFGGGSKKFGLPPGEKRKVKVGSFSRKWPQGGVQVDVLIKCDNYKKTLYSQKWST